MFVHMYMCDTAFNISVVNNIKEKYCNENDISLLMYYEN